jgi:hypothetical protein
LHRSAIAQSGRGGGVPTLGKKDLWQLTFTQKTVNDAFDFFHNGYRNFVFVAGMVGGIGNFALVDTATVPDANANATIGYTAYDLNVYRVIGRRPPARELGGNRFCVYFGIEVRHASAPSPGVTAMRAIHDDYRL